MNPLKSAAWVALERAQAREIIRERTKAVQTPPKQVEYSGHVGTGGLQGHSVGALYPFAVYGQETASGTRYGVLNTATGWESGPRFTCEEAYIVAEFNKVQPQRGEPLWNRFTAIVSKYMTPRDEVARLYAQAKEAH